MPARLGLAWYRDKHGGSRDAYAVTADAFLLAAILVLLALSLVYADIADELYAKRARKIPRLIKEPAVATGGRVSALAGSQHVARVARCQAEREYRRSDENVGTEEISD